ncbi:hypothetical protein [Streptomyces odontomachi]|nr:hypothetical protein [Streptomyces sp. ODS25]
MNSVTVSDLTLEELALLEDSPVAQELRVIEEGQDRTSGFMSQNSMF